MGLEMKCDCQVCLEITVLNKFCSLRELSLKYCFFIFCQYNLIAKLSNSMTIAKTIISKLVCQI